VEVAREAAAASAIAATGAHPRAAVVVRAGLAEIGGASARIANLGVTALPARVEHLQFAAEFLQHDLGRVAILAALVLPFARLQLAFDIDLRALLQILLGDLGEVVVENDDIVPLGLVLALAGILVAPGLGGGDPEIDDRVARIEPPDFGIRPQIA